MFRVPFNVGGVYRRRGGEGVVRGVVRGVVARRVVERFSFVEAFTVVSVQLVAKSKSMTGYLIVAASQAGQEVLYLGEKYFTWGDPQRVCIPTAWSYRDLGR